MQAANDTKTGDLLPNHDLAGERPAPLTKRQKDKIRMARYHNENNLAAMTIWMDAGLLEQFNEWLKARGKSRREVIENVIKTQILRKR